MTDTGWTFGGFRVIESENAPDPNGIKHLGTVSSDHTPFLSRIVNTCDLHGAILDVTDPVQNMRAAYDYHTRRSVNTSKERTMTTHIDQLTEWWENAEVPTRATLPKDGDQIIIRYNSKWYEIATADGDVDEHDLAADTRILARAPKPKPAWHDAVAVMADDGDGDRMVWTLVNTSPPTWESAYGFIRGSADLNDVTPLIEAKVTDEMVLRALNASMGLDLPHHTSYKRDEVEDMRFALHAALNIDPSA